VKLIATPGITTNCRPSGADSALVTARTRAFQWRGTLETGRYGTINELATAEKINSSYVVTATRWTNAKLDRCELNVQTN
jgi:hypothetical protein